MEKYSLEYVDGNAFCIIGYVMAAMKTEGYDEDTIVKEYVCKTFEADYDNLVALSIAVLQKLNKKYRN